VWGRTHTYQATHVAPSGCQTSTFSMSLEVPQCFIPIEATCGGVGIAILRW